MPYLKLRKAMGNLTFPTIVPQAVMIKLLWLVRIWLSPKVKPALTTTFSL
jgi:hypothetical protein